MNRQTIRRVVQSLEIDVTMGIYPPSINDLDITDIYNIIDAIENCQDTDVPVKNGIIEIVFVMVEPEQYEIDLYHLSNEDYERYL